jgi:hypothetical protein
MTVSPQKWRYPVYLRQRISYSVPKSRPESKRGMAGVEIKGFQELVHNCNYLSKTILERALQAAEDAAAQVVRQAVEASAPAQDWAARGKR